MAEIQHLFASLVYVEQLDLDDSVVENLKNEEWKRNGNNNAYMSVSNQIHTLEKYKDLMSTIDSHVHIFARDYHKIKDECTFGCSASWINLHKPKDWAAEHFHPNSFISGVLYLDVPYGTGDITFHSNMYLDHCFGPFWNPPLEEHTLHNSSQVHLKPGKGTLILFSSTLKHSVPWNRTDDKERYSFAFDYVPVGKITTYENSITISNN